MYCENCGKKIEDDIVFVGYIKNRGSYLTNLYNVFSSLNINSFFYVLNNIDKKENKRKELETKLFDKEIYTNITKVNEINDMIENLTKEIENLKRKIQKLQRKTIKSLLCMI